MGHANKAAIVAGTSAAQMTIDVGAAVKRGEYQADVVGKGKDSGGCFRCGSRFHRVADCPLPPGDHHHEHKGKGKGKAKGTCKGKKGNSSFFGKGKGKGKANNKKGNKGNNYYEEEWSDDSWNTEASWDTESWSWPIGWSYNTTKPPSSLEQLRLPRPLR